jgi:hypothetical protein
MCTLVGYAASDEGGDPEFVPLAERLLSYQRRSVRLRRPQFRRDRALISSWHRRVRERSPRVTGGPLWVNCKHPG